MAKSLNAVYSGSYATEQVFLNLKLNDERAIF